MEMKIEDGGELPLLVKARLNLGSEEHCVEGCKGMSVSEQLVYMKGESMSILKEFITKNNVPNDVPDELLLSSEDDGDGDGDGIKSKKIRRENN